MRSRPTMLPTRTLIAASSQNAAGTLCRPRGSGTVAYDVDGVSGRPPVRQALGQPHPTASVRLQKGEGVVRHDAVRPAAVGDHDASPASRRSRTAAAMIDSKPVPSAPPRAAQPLLWERGDGGVAAARDFSADEGVDLAGELPRVTSVRSSPASRSGAPSRQAIGSCPRRCVPSRGTAGGTRGTSTTPSIVVPLDQLGTGTPGVATKRPDRVRGHVVRIDRCRPAPPRPRRETHAPDRLAAPRYPPWAGSHGPALTLEILCPGRRWWVV